MVSQPREKVIVHILSGNRHSVREFQCCTFCIGVQDTGCIFGKCTNLLFCNAETAADRSINVLSKLTPIQESHAPIYQRFQSVIN